MDISDCSTVAIGADVVDVKSRAAEETKTAALNARARRRNLWGARVIDSESNLWWPPGLLSIALSAATGVVRENLYADTDIANRMAVIGLSISSVLPNIFEKPPVVRTAVYNTFPKKEWSPAVHPHPRLDCHTSKRRQRRTFPRAVQNRHHGRPVGIQIVESDLMR